MGGRGGDTPWPSKQSPEKQTSRRSRAPLRTLRGDERSETKPSRFGHREQKVPGGLDRAVLLVQTQAFQSDKVPNSYGLWWSVAASILDLIRDVGRAPPSHWEGAKGRVRGARPPPAVLRALGGMDTGVSSKSFTFKSGIQVTHAKRKQNQAFCWCRWLRGEDRFRGAGSPSASIQFLFLLTMQCRALNFGFSLEIERSTVLT